MSRPLNGALFSLMLQNGSVNLRENKEIVNELNVFPVPDGDTGDNMYMTAQAGCDAVVATSDSLYSVAAAAARGMLRGARGNSGVILSRIFAGIAEGFADSEIADVAIIDRAMQNGVKTAYNAVSTPVEGTILTVFREATAFASARIQSDSTTRTYFEDFTDELRRSLERTPDLLAVLKDAGVVDSGGAGLYYMAEGMRCAINGESAGTPQAPSAPAASFDDSVHTLPEDGGTAYGYCTEVLLQLMPCKADAFSLDALNAFLNAEGDSVVTCRTDNIVKLHVHTFEPGRILNECHKYGEFLKLKIENMTLQNTEVVIRNRFSAEAPVLTRAVRKPYGVVTVATGSGIRRSFLDSGADYVVDGGQSMNPSVDDFLKAFDAVNADTIFVLPNNGNIILTAKQAAALYEKATIRVFESRSIGEGYAAISMFDATCGDADDILAGMTDAIQGVVTGVVSTASRDTTYGSITVRKGDYIGFADDVIYSSDRDRQDVLLTLARLLDAGAHDVCILIGGAAIPQDEGEAMTDALEMQFPDAECIYIDGGQPIYDYIIILE